MKKNKLLLGALTLALTTTFAVIPAQAASTKALNPGISLNQLSNQAPVHWVSVAQIAKSLKGKAPMSVGFDIDDTVLYSTPAFFHGKQVFSPNSWAFLKNSKFWDAVSNGWDKYSVPKESGAALLAMHLKRGDKVYFITARPMPTSGKEEVTQILKKDFNIPTAKMHKVIFAGTKHGAKTPYMEKLHIKLFYGDSDGDILDARAAGTEGIRVLRPLNSSNKPMPKNGSLGEKVVVNSQY